MQTKIREPPRAYNNVVVHLVIPRVRFAKLSEKLAAAHMFRDPYEYQGQPFRDIINLADRQQRLEKGKKMVSGPSPMV